MKTNVSNEYQFYKVSVTGCFCSSNKRRKRMKDKSKKRLLRCDQMESAPKKDRRT